MLFPWLSVTIDTAEEGSTIVTPDKIAIGVHTHHKRHTLAPLDAYEGFFFEQGPEAKPGQLGRRFDIGVVAQRRY